MNGQEGCIILVFDLPTLTKPQQKKRRGFISLIKKEGYTMIQESVYCELIGNTKLSKDDRK